MRETMNDTLIKALVIIGGAIFSFGSAWLFNRFKRRNRTNVSDNRNRTDTTRTEQSNDDRTNGKIEARLDTIESIARANQNIFDTVRKRKKDN